MNCLGVGMGENCESSANAQTHSLITHMCISVLSKTDELHDPKRSSGWETASVSKRRRMYRSPSPSISDIVSEAAGLPESGVSSVFDGDVRDDVTTAGLRPRIARIRTSSTQTLRTSGM